MFKKMMERMFKKVDGVVYDMTTSAVGIVKGESIFTVGKNEEGEYDLVENMFSSLSAPIPAWARAVPLDQVKELDMILSQDGTPFGWVTKVNKSSMRVLKPTGTQSNVVPSKVNLLGQGQTVMVISSMGTNANTGGMDPMMMMAMMGDDADMSDLMPMLMMMQGQGGAMDMNAMIPMLMMSKMGKGEDSDGASDMMKMMLVQSMMGQGQQANMMGGMNPMMLALMMGKM